MTRIEIVSGSLSQASIDPVVLKGHELHITVLPSTPFEAFTRRLSSLGKSAAVIYRVRMLLRQMVLAVTPAFLIALGASIMSVLDQSFQLFVFNTPDNIGNRELMLIAMAAVAFLILAFLPAFLSENDNNFVRDWLRKWFTQNSRRQSRLDALMRTLIRRFKINRIVVFNADAYPDSQWPVAVLMPILASLEVKITLHVHHQAIEKISAMFPASRVSTSHQPNYAGSFKAYWPLMDKEKQRLMMLLAECSTLELDRGCPLDEPDSFVSIEIVEYLASSISDAAETTESPARMFGGFIHAAEYDYGVIEYDDRYCRLHTTMLQNLPASTDFREQVASTILKNRNHLLEQSNSPLVALLVYWHLTRNSRPGTDSIAFIEHFIKRTFDSEQNRYFQRYWDLLAGPVPFGSSIADSYKNASSSLYHMISSETLDMLISLKERSGDFESSAKLSKLLIPIHPLKYRVKLAFTLERKGDFTAAYSALPSLSEFEQTEEVQKLYLHFLLRKAWIIVSARMENRKDEGLDAIQRIAGTGITTASGDVAPMDIWSYYNTLANYAEWEGRYDEAIVHYEQCLSIAGLGYFRYGGTFVNMGIAYRFAALQQGNPHEKLQKAVELGAIGCQFKRVIDDLDELPIALHNQALNLLELWNCDPRKEHLRSVEAFTKEGLVIVERNNGIKRYGMLATEYAISLILQKKNEGVAEALGKIRRWPALLDAAHYDEVKNMAVLIDRFVPDSKKELFEKILPVKRTIEVGD
jgi:tetratricopeptide (TPR) repeat protein